MLTSHTTVSTPLAHLNYFPPLNTPSLKHCSSHKFLSINTKPCIYLQHWPHCLSIHTKSYAFSRSRNAKYTHLFFSYFSINCFTANTSSISFQHPLPFLNPHCSSPTSNNKFYIGNLRKKSLKKLFHALYGMGD